MKFRKRTENFVNSAEEGGAEVKTTKRPFTVMRRTASEIRNYRIIKKFALIIVALATAFLLIIFGLAMLYNRTGRFSVSINNPNENFAIALSPTTGYGSGGTQMGGGEDSAEGQDTDYSGEKADINDVTKTSRLVTDAEVQITNTTGDDLPYNLDQIDGDHSSNTYLAYTFYCWNTSRQDVAIKYELDYNNVTNGIDEAVRVRLYVNGKSKNYAKTRSDGGGKEEFYCDETFATQFVVCYGEVPYIPTGGYVKFTVVIWLEGNDVDCVDQVIDGTIKFDMGIEAHAAEV